MKEPITINQNGCARCGGRGHEGITFNPLTWPIMRDGEVIATHWAYCPVNGEPILLTIIGEQDETA